MCARSLYAMHEGERTWKHFWNFHFPVPWNVVDGRGSHSVESDAPLLRARSVISKHMLEERPIRAKDAARSWI